MGRWIPLRSAGSKTIALSVGMFGIGIALWSLSFGWPAPAAPTSLGWWILIPGAIGADSLVFHLELKGEAHTFTLSEIPIVLGFFFAPPHIVILSRVVGGTLYQIGRRRQSGVKLAFNVGEFAFDAAMIVTFLHLLVGSSRPQAPATWVLALVAVIVTELTVMAVVTKVISWHGGETKLDRAAFTTFVMGVVNTSLGLLAADLLWRDPPVLVLLGIVLAVSFLAYRAYFNLSKRYSSLQLLYDFTKVVSRSMRAEAVLNEILGKARQLLDAETAEVILFDPSSGQPTLRHRNTGDGDGQVIDEPDSGSLAAVWRRVVDTDRAVVVPRTAKAAEMTRLRDVLGLKDLLLAPLRSDEGVVGAIIVGNRLGQVRPFDDEDCRLFETLANHASVAFDNSRLVHQLRQEVDERRREAEERRHEALHDSLTGLPNRTHFAMNVDECLRRGDHAAVMLMDLDRFKEVNDTLGHHHGDLLLSEVATRLMAAVREKDMAARLGGDEFAVLVSGIDDLADAERIARRILEGFTRPFEIQNLSLDVGVSIGIAAAPGDGFDSASLLQKADVAMYEAKSTRSGFARYSPERDTFTPRRLALAGGLRQAIDDHDLVVHFQPKARLSDGQIIAAEALVRWRHRELGMIFPDEFIPIAEQTGLEPQLTAYVLRAALRQCAAWHRAGHHVGVAVNLAVRSLLDSQLPESVGRLIEESGVLPGHLTLEITESGVMADPDRTIAVLDRLAALGLHISVDDFGTGYSSLSYLQRLPVHEVKIDKSFVFRMSTDSNDAVIVESIIDLGHKLGLSVVAEGVEDQICWDWLRTMGCDVAQGYHLTKPIPGTAMTEWLNARRLLEAELAPGDVGAAAIGAIAAASG